MNKRDLKKHMDDLRKTERTIKERLDKERELTPTQKVVGVLLLLGFVAILFLGSYAAFLSGSPIIPYNPEVMNWELPWWMVN